MPKALSKYISINSNILGGTPVVVGTRIPVERLQFLVKSGYTTKDLHEEYPHVEIKKIQFLMAYLMEAGLDAFTKYQSKK